MKPLLLAVLLLLPTLAYSDAFTLTGPTGPLTIIEGNSSNPLTFTFTNNSTSSMVWEGLVYVVDTVVGDSSDHVGEFSVVTDTCIATPAQPNGGTCQVTVSIPTDNDTGETDGDEGTQNWQLGLQYKAPGLDDLVHTIYSDAISITVQDPGAVPSVPEPASVCLFATVLVGSALLVKRKQATGSRLR